MLALGHKAKDSKPFTKLPYHSCALSFEDVKDPLCTPDGYLFDRENIELYHKTHPDVHPVTGGKLSMAVGYLALCPCLCIPFNSFRVPTGVAAPHQDLFPVTFYKNASGDCHCPITEKGFSEYSPIVIVKPTGNVYGLDAVQTMNFDLGNWTDLVNGKKFKRADVITLQVTAPLPSSRPTHLSAPRTGQNLGQPDPKELTRQNFEDFHHMKHRH
eukprot:gene3743-4151_t